MGRNGMWYFLGNNKDEAEIKISKVMGYVKEHNECNNREERGEDIDSVIYHTFKDKKDIWLVIYSPGGIWVSKDYFLDKYPTFARNLIDYTQYSKKKKYYANRDFWDYHELDLNKYEIPTLQGFLDGFI